MLPLRRSFNLILMVVPTVGERGDSRVNSQIAEINCCVAQVAHDLKEEFQYMDPEGSVEELCVPDGIHLNELAHRA